MELKRVRPDWVSLFAESLLIVDQNPLRDYILEELLQAGHKDLVQETILRLTRHPETAPTAILWYFQKILDGKEVPLSHQEGLNLFLETFFVLLHKLEPVSKEMVKKMHTFLTAGRFAHVRQVFQKADLETIKEVLLLSTKCITLSDHELKILYSLAEVVHPSLSSLRKEEAEDHVVWTTEEGYLKIKERIEQIATVETVENAREIEVARSHGDLRENSEYKFALEKRSRLQSELRFLSDQFKQMRVLTKNDISTDTVHVGTVVTLSDAAGKTTTYTLLGPWDADPEKQILSFQSKIAKDLIGLKPGDSCRIQDHDWHITSIKSFL